MKLFTIGDSIAQGFMSGAAARTDLCFSTLIAQAMGLKTGYYKRPEINYHYPEWPKNGIPTNIEEVLRKLNQHYGTNIRGVEWLTTLQTINSVLDTSEDYYERGEGREDRAYPRNVAYFHNVAIQVFTVADAWLVTPALCKEQINAENENVIKNYFMPVATASFYRIALKVLNPTLDPAQDDYHQLKWLEHHVLTEGVENLILWLGANNALGTVIKLKINPTRKNPNERLCPCKLSHLERERRDWNLWHPDDFEEEYSELLDKIDAIMQKNSSQDWNVFIGTIPLVTIAPFAKGVGTTTDIPESRPLSGGVYYKYYTYFPFEEDFAHTTGHHLTMQEAMHIDEYINQYNKDINELVKSKNSQKTRYYVVDICEALNKMAWKRNNGNPKYKYPEYFDYIYPKVNTKYYHSNAEGTLRQGGIFSLDGVHPTAIGQGIIAHEFMKVMKEQAKVVFKTDLNWEEIFNSDTLYQQPISLMQEIYQHNQFAQFLVTLVKMFKD